MGLAQHKLLSCASLYLKPTSGAAKFIFTPT